MRWKLCLFLKDYKSLKNKLLEELWMVCVEGIDGSLLAWNKRTIETTKCTTSQWQDLRPQSMAWLPFRPVLAFVRTQALRCESPVSDCATQLATGAALMACRSRSWSCLCCRWRKVCDRPLWTRLWPPLRSSLFIAWVPFPRVVRRRLSLRCADQSVLCDQWQLMRCCPLISVSHLMCTQFSIDLKWCQLI